MPIVLSNQTVDRAVGQSAANTAARSERSLADPMRALVWHILDALDALETAFLPSFHIYCRIVNKSKTTKLTVLVGDSSTYEPPNYL